MPNPSPQVWMKLPAQTEDDNVPPGLSSLTKLNKFRIEEIYQYVRTNTYIIKNENGETVYQAVRLSSWNRRCRWPWGGRWPFELRILDIRKNEIIHLRLELNCNCYLCCPQKMEVYCPPGNLVGTVEQVWSCCMTFDIKNEMGITVMKIKRSLRGLCNCSCPPKIDYDILSSDELSKVGKITNLWRSPLQVFSNADIFEVTFPFDLDVRMKAVMIGACFSIDRVSKEDW